MGGTDFRQEWVIQARRLVVKVGSGVLTGDNGVSSRIIGQLAAQIAKCRDQGREVVLVSSGAIASGAKRVGLPEKPKSIPQQQACAAVGQAGLMMAYERAFARRGHKVAQILLTADDLSHRRRYLNARNTMTTLLEWNIIPIVNENDTVVVNEIKFGDNDTLAGMITGLVEAELFINLTDIDGLYDSDPRTNPQAEFQPVISNVSKNIEAMASKIPGALGAGGMYTKVLAAKKTARQGVPCIIANGKKARILEKIMEGRAEGTLFLPQRHHLSQRKHWIAFTTKPRGHIVVDDGAKLALLERGKSLLPPGVQSSEGHFDMGDCVRVLDRRRTLVAVGLTNYSSDELRRVAGCQTCDIEGRLGYKHYDEIIHRNNMVVGEDLQV